MRNPKTAPMPSPKLRAVLLLAFAVAAYALSEWSGTCDRCAAIDPADTPPAGDYVAQRTPTIRS